MKAQPIAGKYVPIVEFAHAIPAKFKRSKLYRNMSDEAKLTFGDLWTLAGEFTAEIIKCKYLSEDEKGALYGCCPFRPEDLEHAYGTNRDMLAQGYKELSKNKLIKIVEFDPERLSDLKLINYDPDEPIKLIELKPFRDEMKLPDDPIERAKQAESVKNRMKYRQRRDREQAKSKQEPERAHDPSLLAGKANKEQSEPISLTPEQKQEFAEWLDTDEARRFASQFPEPTEQEMQEARGWFKDDPYPEPGDDDTTTEQYSTASEDKPWSTPQPKIPERSEPVVNLEAWQGRHPQALFTQIGKEQSTFTFKHIEPGCKATPEVIQEAKDLMRAKGTCDTEIITQIENTPPGETVNLKLIDALVSMSRL